MVDPTTHRGVIIKPPSETEGRARWLFGSRRIERIARCHLRRGGAARVGSLCSSAHSICNGQTARSHPEIGFSVRCSRNLPGFAAGCLAFGRPLLASHHETHLAEEGFSDARVSGREFCGISDSSDGPRSGTVGGHRPPRRLLGRIFLFRSMRIFSLPVVPAAFASESADVNPVVGHDRLCIFTQGFCRQSPT